MDSDIWLPASIGLYVVVSAAVAWYAFRIKKSSPFEPIGQYIFFLGLFTLPLPIRSWMTTEVEGDVSPFLPTILEHLPAALTLTSLSLPLFALGYYSKLALKVAGDIPSPPMVAQDHPYRAASFLALLAFILISLLAEDVGGPLALVLKGYSSAEEMFGRGYLAVGFPMSFVSTLFLLYAYAQKKTRLRLALFICCFMFVAAVHVLMGNRSQLLYFALILITFYNYTIAPIKLWRAISIGALCFVALNIMGLARGANYRNIDDFIESFSKGASVAHNEMGGSGLFYTLTVGQFVVPFEALPLTISLVDNEEPLWLGLSYIRAPLNIIPAVIYPDKPQSLSSWYIARVYGGGAKSNEGRQFFFLAEGYLNFGVIGVATLALLWGISWGILQRWMEFNHANKAVAMVYALCTGFLFRCISGDAVTIASALPQQGLLPLFLGILVLTNLRPWRSVIVAKFGRRAFATSDSAR